MLNGKDTQQTARQAFARLGGLARAKALTKAQRVAIATKASAARWAKHRRTRKAGA